MSHTTGEHHSIRATEEAIRAIAAFLRLGVSFKQLATWYEVRESP